MPKYIRRSSSSNSRSTTDTRDVLLRELEQEGQKLLKQMLGDFTKNLEQEGSRVLQGLFSGSGSSSGGVAPGLNSAAQLVGALVSYAVSKPKTTSSTAESDRSKNAAADFRVSRAQAMAEATSELARSERNL